MDPMTDELYEEQKKKGGTVTSAGTPGTVPQQPEVPVMQVNDYSSWLKEMNAAKQQAALAELDAAYQKNVASVDRAEKGLARDYQTARNQTVGASEQAKRNFAQYAAASGLNSGTGGQAELARSVTLQNNLNAINQQEADTLADSALKRAQLEIDYNNAIAKARAEGDYELANALYQEKVRVQDATREEARYREQFDYTKERDAASDDKWQQQFDYGKERDAVADSQYREQFDYTKEQDAIANNQWQQQFAQNKAQQEYENLFNQQKYTDSQSLAQQENLAGYGQAYLQAGVMPSPEMLTAMGITEADAKMYITAVKNADGANYTMVGEALTDMVRAGANMTELRSALRGALNEGILTQAEYEQLCGIYLPGWRT